MPVIICYSVYRYLSILRTSRSFFFSLIPSIKDSFSLLILANSSAQVLARALRRWFSILRAFEAFSLLILDFAACTLFLAIEASFFSWSPHDFMHFTHLFWFRISFEHTGFNLSNLLALLGQASKGHPCKISILVP